MRLVQLIYCSRVVTGVHGTAITSIVDVSRFNNARDGVTGALCFNANFFLQCLEGERSAVNETYHRILHDPRHERALLLRYAEVSKRQFGDWSREPDTEKTALPFAALVHRPGEAAMGFP